jgi:hypothetical protein
LHLEGEKDPAQSLKIYADPEGMIQFHVQPSAESNETVKFVIDCVKDGKTTQYSVDIRGSHTPTEAMPPPPAERALAYQHTGRAQPGLTLDEALHITDEETLARGLPLRPNPDDAPRAFHTWLNAVSTPMTVVEPYLISNPEVSHGKGKQHGPASFTNWSGFELDRSRVFSPVLGGGIRFTAPYDWVAGEWIVPAVTGELGTKTYSAFWVGLDGDNTNDLVQAGTEQDCLTVFFPFGNINITTYYAWTEFLPQQPTEQVISNFAIRPGDRIFTEVWIGNAGSSRTLSGFFGVFVIMNLTTSVTTSIYTPVGTTRVGGTEAVWIMERPTVGGALPDLANYAAAIMSNASARQANSSHFLPYQGAANKQIAMTNLTNTANLSTVTPINASSMLFLWQRFK